MLKRNTPIIRAAKRKELPELSTLIVASLSPFLQAAPAHIVAPYIEHSRRIEDQWDNGEVVVLESAGGIVGAGVYYARASGAAMELPADWAGMRTLVVHPDARGRGFGRMLVRYFVERARRDGAEVLALHTSAFMENAIRIYEATGFVRCPEHDLLGSVLLGADPALGEVQVIAYRIDLSGCRSGSTEGMKP